MGLVCAIERGYHVEKKILHSTDSFSFSFFFDLAFVLFNSFYALNLKDRFISPIAIMSLLTLGPSYPWTPWQAP